MKIADLYIRVSTDEQADKGYSQRDQEERLRKYCEINSIQIRKVIYEDHSAKTFNRPEWKKYMVDLRRVKGQVDFVLFIKWDRFSRNAGDAYAMINTLRKLGVEPQAVEQPLDLSIPENKMMLAFYLAAPEVENDRRALNVFHGMRRAKKEGRYMGCAPMGYVNEKIDGKKTIIPHPDKSKMMVWAFERVSQANIPTDQVRREFNRKTGIPYSKNAFRRALENPVYIGKVKLDKYGDEDECLIEGVHQAIISEDLFYKVQDVLSGKQHKPFEVKINGDILFPLRGMLECPKCGGTLTASSSKGKLKYYHYYHCRSRCGVRFPHHKANKGMVDLLKKYEIPYSTSTLVDVIFRKIFEDKMFSDSSDLKSKKSIVKSESDRIKRARDLLISGDLDAADYREIKTQGEDKINRLQVQIEAMCDKKVVYDPNIISRMCNLSSIYTNATAEQKKEIQCSIFNKKLIFDGESYRTPDVNSVIDTIAVITNTLRENKKGQIENKSDLPCIVHSAGVEPTSSEPESDILSIELRV